MQGIIINYNPNKGCGFIRSDAYQENIFVHISNVTNANELFQGQSVDFEVTESTKGLSATSVIAGRKQRSPYFIFGIISAFLMLGIFWYLSQHMQIILAYFVAINISTFLMYGYDKMIAGGNKLRVPEWILHGLAILGGSPAGLVAQKFFRHKTVKGSFQLVYWLIVLGQGVLIWFLQS
ncbi:cold-shock DNA-binding domain-containing protein [Candidatus Thiomargarita nelsonii]|uniref:Cold-shock DNA-binding domain-containing protein n=1 Tax=Candidatus Thiomargarita nelsonii TaxID=1003181 RepID=A0A176S7W9_9GAMM|nr:cold-shock DNA-binding domain-containing protein [Candidatus Thiomargarita nelsonii]